MIMGHTEQVRVGVQKNDVFIVLSILYSCCTALFIVFNLSFIWGLHRKCVTTKGRTRVKRKTSI